MMLPASDTVAPSGSWRPASSRPASGPSTAMALTGGARRRDLPACDALAEARQRRPGWQPSARDRGRHVPGSASMRVVWRQWRHRMPGRLAGRVGHRSVGRTASELPVVLRPSRSR
jgi:hypothetical protein